MAEAASITFYLDNDPVEAFAGETVAGALLRHGIGNFGTHPVEQRTMAPFCMMGICHECAMEIDGQKNRQACLIPVREGLKVRRNQDV